MIISHLECYNGLITSLPVFILARPPNTFWNLPSVQDGQVTRPNKFPPGSCWPIIPPYTSGPSLLLQSPLPHTSSPPRPCHTMRTFFLFLTQALIFSVSRPLHELFPPSHWWHFLSFRSSLKYSLLLKAYPHHPHERSHSHSLGPHPAFILLTFW